VLGASAPIPLRVKDAEPMLIGQKLDDTLLEEVAQKASEAAEPVSDIQGSEEYRRRLIRALTKRNIKKAWEAASRA